MRIFLLCLITLFTAPHGLAKTIIPIATEANYPPYSFMEHKAVTGIYVEFIHQINQNMPDFEIELHPMSWPVAKNKMQNGELPGLLGAYYHGHDWDYLYPYSQPLWVEEVILVCHKDRVKETGLSWPKDFKGNLVSNINGYDGWLNNNVRAKNITDIVNLIEVPDITTAWRMVYRKIVDCTLFEERAIEALEKTLGANEHVHIAARVTSEYVHIGFSNHKSIVSKWPQISQFRKQLDNAIYLTKRQRAETLN